MKQLVTFLEKYAQFLALGLGVAFLVYMAYSYALNTDEVAVKVGSTMLTPGEVDTTIAKDAQDLSKRTTLGVPKDLQKKFEIPAFSSDFEVAMGPTRKNYVLKPGKAFPDVNPAPDEKGTEAPKSELVLVPLAPPVAINNGSTVGNSFVAQPAPLPPLNPDPAAPQPPQPAGVPVTGMELNWIVLEWKIDFKDLAKAWTDALKAGVITAQIRDGVTTQFLWVEVQREEQTGPNQWGNPVTLKPLPLTQVSQVNWPKNGEFPTPDAKEEFRIWSASPRNQNDLVEPPFYQVLSGDTWSTVSIVPKADPGAAVQPAINNNAPFDPANPPARELTPQERQAVYLYNKKLKDDKAKEEGMQRKAKADAAAAAQKAKAPAGGTPSRGGAGGGKKTYAPLPLGADEYGAAAKPISPNAIALANPTRPGGESARPTGPESGRPTPGSEGRRPVPGTEGRRPVPAPVPGANPEVRPIMPTPGGEPGAIAAGFQASPVLTGPFNPALILSNPVANPQQASNDIVVWAHDTQVEPGKVYRYRMRYFIKNPLYETLNLFKDPKFGQQLAVGSPYTPWTSAQAPSNVHFFFADKKNDFRNQNQIKYVEVDVFKRQKGAWVKERYQCVPGDSIGGTTWTVVDLRLDARNEPKIIISDENGTMETRTLAGDLAEPFYKDLQDKVKGGGPPAAGGAIGGPAASATPALINPVR